MGDLKSIPHNFCFFCGKVGIEGFSSRSVFRNQFLPHVYKLGKWTIQGLRGLSTLAMSSALVITTFPPHVEMGYDKEMIPYLYIGDEMSGKFFVIEGPDGVGKSTIVANLRQRFRQENLKFAFLRQPAKYRSEISRTRPENWMRMLYLFMKDREEQYNAIRELLVAGHHVFMDRYYHSSCVYQSVWSDFKVTPKDIYYAHGPFILKPEVTFLLDIPDEVAEGRLRGRVSVNDLPNFEGVFEKRQGVREGYRNLSSLEEFHECVSVSNDRKVMDTIKDLCTHLGPLLGLET
jgi:dTMP kinase